MMVLSTRSRVLLLVAALFAVAVAQDDEGAENGRTALRDGDRRVGMIMGSEVFEYIYTIDGTTFEDDQFDMHVTLDVLSGDADLVVKGPRRFLSYSEHPSGADVLYIPREQILYSCKDIKSCVFRVILVGYSPEAEFEMIFDTEKDVRDIHPDDQEALETIYAQCCRGENSCMAWASAVDASKNIPVAARALGPDRPVPATNATTTENFCHLPGQICDNNGRITHLRLSSQLMNCELPEALATLTALERLFMFSNEITGTFEQFLDMAKGMKNLNHVHMADMGLHGNLACCESGSSECLSHLKTLDMKRNSLQGDLPECLLDLPKIGVLDLKENKLTGTMPATLNPNPHMIVLDLRDQSGDGMTGPVPDLRPLENLALVGLSGNAFTGAFPGLPAKLEAVHISDTELEGDFHSSVDELTKIWVFEAANSRLTGPIPASFWKSESLKLLDLSNNQLSGGFPDVLTSANLRVLRLQDNVLTGGIPAGLASLNRLGLLNLTNNRFTGSLEPYGSALGFNTLKVFSVSHNQLTGSIPESIERLGVFSMFPTPGSSNRQVFDVSFNQLDGEFPDHVVATVLNLSSELQSQFEFNIQGNYMKCPRDEVKTTILKELPDVADSTCQDGDKLRTVRSDSVPASVKQLMQEHRKPEPVVVEEEAEAEEEIIEEEEEEEEIIEEEEKDEEETVEEEEEEEEEEDIEEMEEEKEEKDVEEEQDVEEDRDAVDTIRSSFSTTVSTSSTNQVGAAAAEDDGKPVSPMLIIIPCAVVGGLALVGLAAVFVVKPMIQKRRGEQYRDYDAEAADNPVLQSKGEVSSDQAAPIPTMTQIDNS